MQKVVAQVIEVRCQKCNKLLGLFEGKGEIKCPRTGCGQINRFNVTEGAEKKNDSKSDEVLHR